MTTGDILSFAINFGVGIYLAHFYPKSVRRKLAGGRLPPFFAAAVRVTPALGYVIIGGTLVYMGLRLTG